jgi:hypothetical protein
MIPKIAGGFRKCMVQYVREVRGRHGRRSGQADSLMWQKSIFPHVD